jgi:hypothetical protein
MCRWLSGSVADCQCELSGIGCRYSVFVVPVAGSRMSVVWHRLLIISVGFGHWLLIVIVGCRASVVDCHCRLSVIVVDCRCGCRASVADCWCRLLGIGC